MSDENDASREGAPVPNKDLYDEIYDKDRKRGIFTSNDREYLMSRSGFARAHGYYTGESEIEGQEKYNLLFRLRERLKNALLDIALLSSLPDDQLKKVAEPLDKKESADVIRKDLFDFTFRYLQAHPKVSDPIERTESVLESTIRSLDDGEKPIVDVTVDIKEEREEFDSLIEQVPTLLDNDEVYDPVITALIEHGGPDEAEKLRDLDAGEKTESLARFIDELDDDDT